MFKSKYFKHLIYYGLLLGILPILIITGLVYMFSSNIIVEQASVNNTLLLNQTMMRVNDLLLRCDRSLQHFVQNKQLHSLLQQDINYELYAELNSYNNDMDTLLLDEGLENAALISLTHNWLLTPKGLVVDGYGIDWNTLANECQDTNSTWLINRGKYPFTYQPHQLINERLSHDLILVKKVLSHTLESIGLVSLEVPHELIEKKLGIPKKGKYVLVFDESYNVIASQLPLTDDLYPDLLTNLDFSQLKESHKSFILNIQGHRYSIVYTASTYNNWTYLSVTDIGLLTQEANTLRKSIILVTTIIVLINICIVLVASNKIYLPIINLWRSIVSEDYSRYTNKKFYETADIHTKFGLLLSDNKSMAHELRHTKNQLKEHFTLKLLNGKLSEKDVDMQINSYEDQSSFSLLSIIVCTIDTLEDSSYTTLDLDCLLITINQIIYTSFKDNIFIIPIVDHLNQVTIFKSNEDEDNHNALITKHVSTIQNQLFNDLGLQVSFGISNPYASYNFIHTAYNEAKEALLYQIQYGYSSILFSSDVHGTEKRPIDYPNKLVDELLMAISDEDYKTSKIYLAQFVNVILQGNQSTFAIKVNVYRLVIAVVNMLQNIGLADLFLDNMGHNLFNLQEQFTHKSQIIEWLWHKTISPSIGVIENSNRENTINVYQQLISIVENEYNTDITIEVCANRVGYHPNYLRRLFKKEMGINFSEYLKDYRMNKARLWLKTTDMTIRQISKDLQYNNSQNFIRSFKKRYGVTPGVFRKTKID